MKEWIAWTFLSACCVTARGMWETGQSAIPIDTLLLSFIVSAPIHGVLMWGRWKLMRRYEQ